MFIIYCSVSGITETNYIFVSTENNLLIQTVKCSLLKEKEKALGLCLTVCPRYAALKFGTRVCALHCHLPVSPDASKLRTQSCQRITFSFALPLPNG